MISIGEKGRDERGRLRLDADEATFARRDDAAYFDDGQSHIAHRSIEEATAEEIARNLT